MDNEKKKEKKWYLNLKEIAQNQEKTRERERGLNLEGFF